MSDGNALLNKLVKLRNRLVDLFVQREAEITAVLAGLISGEPVILVGPPGTAKTMMVETLAKMIDCLLYTSPSPRDLSTSRMPSSA